MPLLKPDIRKALEAAGLENPNSDESTIKEILNARGLSKEDLIDRLSGVAEDAENDNSRLRAIELGFKLHGMLKDTIPQAASVTIVIQDPENKNSFNPSLFPRQMTFESDTPKKRKALQ